MLKLGGLATGAAMGTGAEPDPVARRDYARARFVEDWLHHPSIGDPSWDTFVRDAGNPILRGSEPYWWPVNGTLFLDPVSRAWFAFVSVYPRGYWPPPPADSVILREGAGRWEKVGVVFGNERPPFACKDGQMGAATDCSVVYDRGRYHMIYGWCDPANRRGGLGYASAARPEGPYRCSPAPIHDDARQAPILGRYVRAYASTLIRRKRDWLIIHMMSTPGNAGGTWALFAMTALEAVGPYSPPTMLLAPQQASYHPALAEFFPAFVRRGRVYAPATSVAANRSYQSLFSAEVEVAHRPDAWRIDRLGSMWHAESHDWESRGIWGQTIAGVVAADDTLRVMYPAKDSSDRGGVGMARRSWSRPLDDGFVVSAPNALAHAVLRRWYGAFDLEAEIASQGAYRVCWSCRGPLGPSHGYADSVPSVLMARSRRELRIEPGGWRIMDVASNGRISHVGAGELPRSSLRLRVAVRQSATDAVVRLGDSQVWHSEGLVQEGRIEILAETGSHVKVDRFSVAGHPGRISDDWLASEAIAGSAPAPGEWQPVEDPMFRYGSGYETEVVGARAKWNVTGRRLTLWSPRRPGYGEIAMFLDGRPVGTVSLRSAAPMASAPVATFDAHPGRHAFIIECVSGRAPCDALTVEDEF
jgi:hypothetical protein